ncbi:putative gliding motility-associated protein GldE [Helianthus annuus]|uniref:Gliding motility-associated protein GldE n=2 Tax=Helianthus annuus TaxID=4232 RepID=A0A251TH10_HELAN|nr:putative gliding motility-associated protein GldE [Helianthus annuus]KAJ0512695.1 putative CBS domain, CNNM, transmembrane domain-containing protein [Helianthus annuus]KAJ0528823.1 putative CBS domain, CNNM, transmembrane domain-containing protein [Helianthus annuus]KAJ0695736.1 putative CBS domain, CNNM, transmembrane domain-containing protein [Helianthus annuus]
MSGNLFTCFHSLHNFPHSYIFNYLSNLRLNSTHLQKMNLLTLAAGSGSVAGAPASFTVIDSNTIAFGNPTWFIYAGVSCVLVLFAGIMSGLTLGLMSLGVVELEILQRSGTDREKKQAAVILPIVQRPHQLLVTLLLCNAAAMEALPIYLEKIFHPAVAVLLSVTFVLAFGEVIPQAISTRYGLAVGANFVGLVRLLMVICYPIAYPVGKILDALIGHNDTMFRRAQLKALVSIHSQEAGKGGELTHDEITIISGALDLTEKTAEEAMTPIESTFSLDVNSKLNWEAFGKILGKGHSRVPVYSGNLKNIIGLLLVKSLLTVRPETETPVSDVSIRKIPRVPANMPLYDILNEFQKGGSHMAAVVKVQNKNHPPADVGDLKLVGKNPNKHSQLTKPLLPKLEEESDFVVNIDKTSKSTTGLTPKWSKDFTDGVEDGEVIGIITLEDVFEELLQEEIVDETDVYIDVHKRIRVAAAAAASYVARAPSTRRLATQRSLGLKEDKDNPPLL